MSGPSRRWLLVAGAMLALIAWQASIFRTDLPDTYAVKASGLHAQRKFVYFLYYANLFPVASLKSGRDFEFYYDNRTVAAEPDTLDYSREGAQSVLAGDGDTLVMEWAHSLRNGGDLAPYLYLLDAWRLGSPQHAEIRVAAAAAFVLGLIGILLACWYCGAPWLGVALVVLLGSNPFQLFEAYRRENVFGWPIAVFCILIAAFIPLLARRATAGYAWIVAIASAVVLGTALHIRLENGAMLLTVVVGFLIAPGLRMTSRAALIAVACVGCLATWLAWDRYFEHKWQEATEVVTRAGGHPYVWQRTSGHEVWWTIWAGLGDFDTKYGYSYDDNDGIAYAQRVVKARYGEELPWWFPGDEHERTAADYFDASRVYYRHPMQSPHFMDVLREKVLHDIVTDPAWYAGILVRRGWRILTHTTPVQVFVTRDWQLVIPFAGFLVLPVGLAALWRRDRLALGVILCSLPLSLTAFAIYSLHNFTYYSVYHLCTAAVLGAWAIEATVQRMVRRRGADLPRVEAAHAGAPAHAGVAASAVIGERLPIA